MWTQSFLALIFSECTRRRHASTSTAISSATSVWRIVSFWILEKRLGNGMYGLEGLPFSKDAPRLRRRKKTLAVLQYMEYIVVLENVDALLYFTFRQYYTDYAVNNSDKKVRVLWTLNYFVWEAGSGWPTTNQLEQWECVTFNLCYWNAQMRYALALKPILYMQVL